MEEIRKRSNQPAKKVKKEKKKNKTLDLKLLKGRGPTLWL